VTTSGVDVEFFFDPVCPWCWITSRWVVNVQAQRQLRVGWRFISLDIVNADVPLVAGRRGIYRVGRQSLRVADELCSREGNEAVGAYYTGLGTLIHKQQRRAELIADPLVVIRLALTSAGLDSSYAEHALDRSHDVTLARDTSIALDRAGADLGAPILTLGVGTAAAKSFFGPVLPKAPTGADAVRLWDAVETLAVSGVAEIKRSARGTRDFG
jgi:DSBA-like thioredoxin domain